MIRAPRLWPTWLCRAIAWLDFGVLLPALARTPQSLAMPLLWLRGSVNFALDLDWRTLSLRHGYVRRATFDAMRALHSTRWAALRATHRRFVCAAQEECDALRLARLDCARLKVCATGIEELLALQASGRGVVLLTAHFDALYVGLAVLAQRGLRINLLSSKMIEDPRIPSSIRTHFSNKLAGLNRVLAPGKVVHHEDDVRFFVDALKRGDLLVIAADGPATSLRRAVQVQFLGGLHMMTGGAEFFAAKAQVPVCAYACHRLGAANYRVQISEPLWLEDGGLQAAYDVLDETIRRSPWRWWAADLHRTFRTRAALQDAVATTNDD